MDEPTIACSLDAQDYRERLASIRRLGEEALLDVKRDLMARRCRSKIPTRCRPSSHPSSRPRPHAVPSSTCPSDQSGSD